VREAAPAGPFLVVCPAGVSAGTGRSGSWKEPTPRCGWWTGETRRRGTRAGRSWTSTCWPATSGSWPPWPGRAWS